MGKSNFFLKVGKIFSNKLYFLQNNRIITINCIAILLGVIASFSVAGYVLKVPVLSKLGKASGISPLPFPFQDMGNGRETMDFRYRVYGRNDENAKWNQLDFIFSSVVDRPHRVGVPFEAVIGFSARTPYPQLESVLRYKCSYFNYNELLSAVYYGKGNFVYVKTSCKK